MSLARRLFTVAVGCALLLLGFTAVLNLTQTTTATTVAPHLLVVGGAVVLLLVGWAILVFRGSLLLAWAAVIFFIGVLVLAGLSLRTPGSPGRGNASSAAPYSREAPRPKID